MKQQTNLCRRHLTADQTMRAQHLRQQPGNNANTKTIAHQRASEIVSRMTFCNPRAQLTVSRSCETWRRHEHEPSHVCTCNFNDSIEILKAKPILVCEWRKPVKINHTTLEFMLTQLFKASWILGTTPALNGSREGGQYCSQLAKELVFHRMQF